MLETGAPGQKTREPPAGSSELRSVPGTYGREIVIPFDGLGDDPEQSRRSRPPRAEARRSRAKYLFEIHAEKYGGEASGRLERVAERVRSARTGDVRAYRVSTYVSSGSSCTCVNGKSSPVYKVLACHALYAMYACATSFSVRASHPRHLVGD